MHTLTLRELWEVSPGRANPGHESNAGDLLAAAQLIDEMPDRLFVVGVEPQRITTGLGLSAPVSAALPQAIAFTTLLVEDELQRVHATG
jgi:hypothetical protein